MNKRSLTPQELALLNEEVLTVELTLMQWVSVRASIQATANALAEEGEQRQADEFRQIDKIIAATVQLDGEEYCWRTGGLGR